MKGIGNESPLKELEMVQERRDLEERVKHLRKSVLEKTLEFEELSGTRKSTEAGLAAQKSRINSFELRKLLLEKKKDKLKVQLLQAKQMLAHQTTKKCPNNKDVKVICTILGIEAFPLKKPLFRMS